MSVKIISGGQTGVDQMALYLAWKMNLPTGGFAPPNFMTSNGPNPLLGEQYHLVEVEAKNPVQGYVARSIKNVQTADATLVFLFSKSSGTMKTIGYALNGKWAMPELDFSTPLVINLPLFCVNFQNLDGIEDDVILTEFRAWISHQENLKTLNVAGNRSIPPHHYERASKLMEKFFEILSEP